MNKNTQDELRSCLEGAFYMFDASPANMTKQRLVDALNLLGKNIVWDEKKGVDAPAPLHIHAQQTGGVCRCFDCGINRDDFDDYDDTDE